MTKPVKVEFGSRDGTVETAWCTLLGGSRYRVELQLFSPTRETREQWRALYDAP